MFNFLKDKLKGALSKFTKKVEESPQEKVEAPAEEPKKVEPKAEEKKPEAKKEKTQQKQEKKESEKKTEPKKEESKKEPKAKPKEEPKVEVKAQEKKVELKPVEEKPIEQPKAVEPVKVIESPKEPVKTEEPKVEPKVESKGFFSKLKETFVGKEEAKVETVSEPKVESKEVPNAEPKAPVQKTEPKPQVQEEEKGFFGKIAQKITTKKITAESFDELFWDLELALLENNVALEVIEKIKFDLKSEIVDKPIARGKVEEVIGESLHKSIEGLFTVPGIDLIARAKAKKPLVVCMVGVNGSGKTTSIAKLTNYLQSHGLTVVLAAADTFRAAAIDQLQLHADKLNVKLIRHDYGADPAAVAFDAIKHAEAAKKDIVLIDTAGRLHSNVNLIDEMKKIVRVAKPDLKIFVGESITGNDCIEQAKKFDEAVGIDGIILAKADIDEKGGAAISVSYVTKKPILFLGVGQEYKDLQVFDKEKLIASIGL